MEIELTSAKDDGSFTWRAAGARQPKGVVVADLLSPAAKVGDVLRVDAEVEVDGITILSVLPGRTKATPAGRIELLQSSTPSPGVTTALLSEGSPRNDRRDLLAGSRRPERRPSRASGGPAPGTRQRPPQGPGSPAARTRSAGQAPEGRVAPRPQRERVQTTPRSSIPPREVSSTANLARDRARDPRRADERDSPRRQPFRLEPGSVHRDELIATLPAEQRPIAEQLALGGLPGVRRALAQEREHARAEGRPEVTGEAIVALAEQLLPRVKQAIWHDRADAVKAHLDKVSLRDLRTTVTSASPHDDPTRTLARTLREELDGRLTKLRTTWESQITHALEEGRVLQALRLSGQPPEPTARLGAALVGPLAERAGAAMTSDTSPERWLAILDGAAASPVRRQIRPLGMPEDPTGELRRRAIKAAGSLPALASLLGLAMPPPPPKSLQKSPPKPPQRRTARRMAPRASGASAASSTSSTSGETGAGTDPPADNPTAGTGRAETNGSPADPAPVPVEAALEAPTHHE